jgi:hypothetical protein
VLRRTRRLLLVPGLVRALRCRLCGSGGVFVVGDGDAEGLQALDAGADLLVPVGAAGVPRYRYRRHRGRPARPRRERSCCPSSACPCRAGRRTGPRTGTARSRRPDAPGWGTTPCSGRSSVTDYPTWGDTLAGRGQFVLIGDAHYHDGITDHFWHLKGYLNDNPRLPPGDRVPGGPGSSGLRGCGPARGAQHVRAVRAGSADRDAVRDGARGAGDQRNSFRLAGRLAAVTLWRRAWRAGRRGT